MLKFLSALFLCTFSICVFSSASFAQEDAEGCQDHPMFNRMPNTIISNCSHNFDQVEVPMSRSQNKTLDGMKTYIDYVYNAASGVPGPSFYQIVKNYENALKKLKGKQIYYSKDAGVATLSMRSDGKQYWLILEDRTGTADGNYIMTVLEMEAMKQDISASGILDDLNTNGSVALYINFETGKSTIEPESEGIVAEIAKMLTDNPSLKISVEGHTDNVGTAAANQKLSTDRAGAIVAALVKAGISKTRLQSKGWGQDKPIETNATEDGRKQNRRVEIVKVT